MSPDVQPWLETLRLALREFVPEDLDDLVRLDSDPRVMRYIGDGRTSTREQVIGVMQRVARVYAIYPGLGTWRAARRDSGAFIGWFTLKYVPKTVEIEVGYRLLPEAWGQGYATEGATALVRYGFDDLCLDRIIGITHKDNIASQRVLRNAGLEPAGWGKYYGWRVRLFEALRDR